MVNNLSKNDAKYTCMVYGIVFSRNMNAENNEVVDWCMNDRNKQIAYRKGLNIWKRIGEFTNGNCDQCGEGELIYIFAYDAMACIHCNEWKEPKCNDPNCTFCAGRPATPYELYWKAKEEPAGDALQRKKWRQQNYQHKEYGRIRHQNRYRSGERSED